MYYSIVRLKCKAKGGKKSILCSMELIDNITCKWQDNSFVRNIHVSRALYFKLDPIERDF